MVHRLFDILLISFSGDKPSNAQDYSHWRCYLDRPLLAYAIRISWKFWDPIAWIIDMIEHNLILEKRTTKLTFSTEHFRNQFNLLRRIFALFGHLQKIMCDHIEYLSTKSKVPKSIRCYKVEAFMSINKLWCYLVPVSVCKKATYVKWNKKWSVP